MSNALVVGELLTALEAAVTTAFGSGVTISEDMPRTLVVPPAVVISWKEVAISFDGIGASMVNPAQKYSFEIYCRFPFPGNQTYPLSRLKADQASLLIAQLQNGPTFAGFGMLPLVTSVLSHESDPPQERIYDFTVTFECLVSVDHH